MGTRVVAIDGPAGAGKSTVARAVAARLGLDCLGTGTMYRAVAVAVLDRCIAGEIGPDLEDADMVAVAEGIDILVALRDGEGAGEEQVLVDGEDVTARVRSSQVGRLVSAVAAVPEVRARLVALQRDWVRARGGGVVEGRDIGSVVFPDAELKVFLTASPEERARRRGDDEDADGVRRRDHLDASRAASPLVVPDGAVVIDSTGRSVDDIVDQIVGLLG